jgi:hypothetical protein
MKNKMLLSNRSHYKNNNKIIFLLMAIMVINPRDFPVNNIPLIYPAFLFFLYRFWGVQIMTGLYRVRYLVSVLIFIQAYILMLRYLDGTPVGIGALAYIIEPPIVLLIFAVVGARENGLKIIVWSFIFLTTLSTIMGGAVIFEIGWVEDFRNLLHESTGGSLLSGDFVREEDLKGSYLELRNTGLGTDVVMFGYILTFALVATSCMLFDSDTYLSSYRWLIYLCFIILVIGAISNAQRSIIIGTVFGLFVYIFSHIDRKSLSLLSGGLIILLVAIVGVIINQLNEIFYLFNNTILDRQILDSNAGARLYMVAPTLLSILDSPLGTPGLPQNYIDAAFKLDWIILKNGNYVALGPHNHFMSVIMFAGVYGIMASIYILNRLRVFFKRIRYSDKRNYENIIFSSCIGLIVHSFFHNSGFFGLNPPTLIAFGALWGAINIKRSRFTIVNSK